MKHRRRFKLWVALALALAALGASAAQAATRPDDRAGPLGVGTQAVVSDRSDVISRYLANRPTAQDPSDVVSRYLANRLSAAPRPDDRAGPLGVGTDTAAILTPAPTHRVTDWGTVALAAGAGAFGAFAVALIGFALVRTRGSATAALQS